MARTQSEKYKDIVHKLKQWIVMHKNGKGYITHRDYMNFTHSMAMYHGIKDGGLVRINIKDKYSHIFFITEEKEGTSKYYIDFYGSSIYVCVKDSK